MAEHATRPCDGFVVVKQARSDPDARHRLGRTPRGRGAPGSLSRWVAATEDGIRVTDVWQTREEFETFAGEQIGPLTAEVGFPTPPQITFLDVHNYDSAEGLA